MRSILLLAAAAFLLGCHSRSEDAGDAEAGKPAIVRFSIGRSGAPALRTETAFSAWTPEAASGGTLTWAEVARVLAKACGNAALAPPEAAPTNDGKLPIHLILRWNPTAGKCKVYVGPVLCNYNDMGLERASSLIERNLTSEATSDLMIAAENEVPCKWVVSSAQMAKDRVPGKAILSTPHSFPDDADFTSALESSPAVEPKDGRSPDANLQCLLHPDAPYGALARLLLVSARHGVRRVLIGSAPGALYPFALSTGGASEGGETTPEVIGRERTTSSAVDMGLLWLKNHQSADGRWSSAGFETRCATDKGKCGGAGSGSDWETRGSPCSPS
jgi:hypothetical protein